MNLIEDDEPVFMSPEEERRIGQLATIRTSLQIEVERTRAFSDFVGQRRLADMARADQGDGRMMIDNAIPPRRTSA